LNVELAKGEQALVRLWRIERPTSNTQKMNIEHPIMMALRFIYFNFQWCAFAQSLMTHRS